MKEIVQGMKRTQDGIEYTVSVDKQVKWVKFVRFGRNKALQAGGPAFRAAALEQERVANRIADNQ